MKKYCAINLNARFRLGFKYSKDDIYVFREKKNNNLFYTAYVFVLTYFIMTNCICITLLKTVTDDLLKCEKIENWCLLKLMGRKGFVKGSHCSNFQFFKRASVKQLFTTHLGLLIISFTNLQIWKKWCEKEMGVVQTCK